MKQILNFILILSFISFSFNQGKLKFSADIAKSYKDGDILAKEFKNNVKIVDRDIILYTNSAIHYHDLNKVVLIGNVRMYQNKDSLKCNELKLFKGINEVESRDFDASILKEIHKLFKVDLFELYIIGLLNKLHPDY